MRLRNTLSGTICCTAFLLLSTTSYVDAGGRTSRSNHASPQPVKTRSSTLRHGRSAIANRHYSTQSRPSVSRHLPSASQSRHSARSSVGHSRNTFSPFRSTREHSTTRHSGSLFRQDSHSPSRPAPSRPLSITRSRTRPFPYYRTWSREREAHHGRHDGHDSHLSFSLGFGFQKSYVEPCYPPTPVAVGGAPVITGPYAAVPAQPALPQEAYPAAPAPAGNVIFQGVVSRDDDIAAKEVLTVDGIVVKIKDTDGHPLDADIEVRLGHHEEEFEDVPIGASIPVVGLSGQTFYLNLLDIEDDSETIAFAIVQ